MYDYQRSYDEDRLKCGFVMENPDWVDFAYKDCLFSYDKTTI